MDWQEGWRCRQPLWSHPDISRTEGVWRAHEATQFADVGAGADEVCRKESWAQSNGGCNDQRDDGTKAHILVSDENGTL